MKIIFFGTGEFGIPTLRKLVESDHEISAVVTQPDSKKGRGWNVMPTPIKALIEQVAPGTDIFQPGNMSDADFLDDLKKNEADIFVVVDYGRILIKEILDLPRKYCVNLHPSLLPKCRGAAPIPHTLLNGEKETGNSIIIMTELMDAGSIILREKVDIGENENSVELFARLSRSGAVLVLEALDLIEKGEEDPEEQNEEYATLAPKLRKQQGKVDWTKSAYEIHCMVRAFQPWPGAYTFLNGKMLKILESRVSGEDKAEDKDAPDSRPGREIIPARGGNRGIRVMTGNGTIRILKVQLEGKKPMTAEAFLRGQGGEALIFT